MQENIENKDNNSVTPVNTVIHTEQQPKQSNFLIILLTILLIISMSIAGFFAFQTQKLVKELTNIKIQPTATPEANVEPTIEPIATNSATTDPTANWKTYVNNDYSFSISFPESYKALTDKENLYGWPNAVALIYNGGQSYDLPIEVWNTEAEYKTKYSQTSSIIVFKTKNNKFVTLSNINSDVEVSKIISTFKFTD